ncbi:MAG: efflux RND transporter periplasmic adaptor subunit [Pseudomonadota bacterium]
MGTARRLIALALISALPTAALAQGRPATVDVDPVAIVAVAETQPLIARFVASDESVVATRVPGIVGEVLVRVGDRVAAGDTLATLDTELLTIERDGAEATLAQAEAGLEVALANESLAEQVLARTQRLRGSAAFSQGRADDLAKELARGAGEKARAEAALAVARAAVGTARYRLNNAVIRAPFDGVVLERLASAGDYLTIGGNVARLMDDGSLEIEADAPTEIVSGLTPGTTISVVMDDGGPGLAKVRAVVPSESPSTRTRPVRLTLTESQSEKALASGQSVTVLAPVGAPREALSVAKDALVQQAGGWIVYAATDGRATPRPVTLGVAIADRYEVTGALEPGDLVVIRGNERLRPGQPIAFEDPAGTVATGSARTEGAR